MQARSGAGPIPLRRHEVPASCPVCHSGDVGLYWSDCRDRLHETPGSWDLLLCRRCGVRFTVPEASERELLGYYPPEYTVLSPEQGVRAFRFGNLLSQMAIWPYRLKYGNPDRVPAPFGTRRALDVGCGAGNYLKRLSALGWEVHGLDFSLEVVRMARSRVPEAFVHHGTLETLRVQTPFAYISLNHVLEHVKDPERVLQRCFELLEAGGRLAISVPNIDSLEARVFGSRWRGLDIPRHLIHFNKAALAELVMKRGFQVTLMRPALFASSLSESLLLSLPIRLKRLVFRSSIIRRGIYYSAMLPACLSYVIGNHAIIELEAIKPYRPLHADRV